MVHVGKDRATGVIVSILGIIILLFSFRFQASRIAEDIGPGVFPMLASVVLLVNGAILIVKDKSKKEKSYFTKEEWIRFGLLLLSHIGYFFLLWVTGFIPATFVVMLVICTMFSQGRNVAIWKRVLFAIIITMGIYWAFFKGLGFRLPLGILIRFEI